MYSTPMVISKSSKIGCNTNCFSFEFVSMIWACFLIDKLLQLVWTWEENLVERKSNGDLCLPWIRNSLTFELQPFCHLRGCMHALTSSQRERERERERLSQIHIPWLPYTTHGGFALGSRFKKLGVPNTFNGSYFWGSRLDPNFTIGIKGSYSWFSSTNWSKNIWGLVYMGSQVPRMLASPNFWASRNH